MIPRIELTQFFERQGLGLNVAAQHGVQRVWGESIKDRSSRWALGGRGLRILAWLPGSIVIGHPYFALTHQDGDFPHGEPLLRQPRPARMPQILPGTARNPGSTDRRFKPTDIERMDIRRA